MKINQAIDSLQTGTSQATGLKGNKPEPVSSKVNAEVSGSTTPAQGGGSLNISQLSTKLQTLESRLADGESFDAPRVSEIKQSIRDGSFKVDAGAVADKLISSAHDLFIKRH
jgi:negative regulator of flagellin synthesis FlgM